MTKKEVNELIISLYQRLIRVRDQEKDSFSDYIVKLTQNHKIIEKLSFAYMFACFFYEQLTAGEIDSSKFNKRDREFISLFYESEDMNFYEDELDEEEDFIDSLKQGDYLDDDSDDDDSSEIN